MELELQRTCLNGFQLILNRTVIQEETLEGIVPDTCPDIMRIIDASGQACLTARELSMGSLRVTGVIHAAVLYIPEGEDGPRHTDLRLPFSCTVDDPALHSGCKLHAALRLCSIDSRAINPRKLLTRAELAVELRVYAPDEGSVGTGATCGEEDALQQRWEERETCLVTALQEKSFTFSDVLDFPASRGQVKELLRSRLEVKNLEAKVIGGKLIMKGEVTLNALCRGGGGMVFSESFHLPYSQVMEAGGVGEECEAEVTPFLTGIDCTLQPGDPASIAVTLELLAQAEVREQRPISLLADLYSISCPLEVERADFAFCRRLGSEVRREGVRQLCECGIPAKTVVDASVAVGRITHMREEGTVTLRAECTVTILFFSEDDALCSVAYPIPVSTTVQPGGECELLCRCGGTGVPVALPAAGGLEARFEVEFSCLMLRHEVCSAVAGIREMPCPESGGRRPSVILRAPDERETLWDIAKAYNSTIGDIVAANGLETEQAPAGKLLLIPRRR